MGQNHTKESRGGSGEGPYNGEGRTTSNTSGDGSRHRNRASRTDLSFLGIGSGSNTREQNRAEAQRERRENRREREAKRLEKEKEDRIKERERSLREEHVDGGYLVTLGTYVGPEDFNKGVVRQLQLERKLAPFWRGIDDFSTTWAEHQIVAAARGLPVPAADEAPDPDLMPRPPAPQQQTSSSSNLHSLTVPMGGRTMSAASDRSASNSNVSSPTAPSPGRKSPFKGPTKALAGVISLGSRNASSTDLGPKEITLPADPFVNGQPMEVFLYKDSDDCPICFLTYPPYLNQTRCCGQMICSECFVQIKRPEPHAPEHHPDGQARDPNAALDPQDPPETLVSEPSACPYCTMPEFGVTYDPPPFRRGLAYAHTPGIPHSYTAMSSQTSLNSTVPPSPSQPSRRRTHSLSATAPNVITTDRVRPDWATKLATARAHQARRAAAATALHHAAFLSGNDETSGPLSRLGRLSRRNTSTNNPSGTTSESQPAPEAGTEGGEGRRRNRMEELDAMMMAEAMRLSIADEDARQKKHEKALRKEAKKKLKEEKKAEKKRGNDPYSGGASGASGSSLSLGFGRRRGNSGASNLRVEATVQSASQSSGVEENQPDVEGKGKGIDRSNSEASAEGSSPPSLPIPATPTRGGSHLRQMSNASSIGSSGLDTPSGSYPGAGLQGPEGSKREDPDSEPLFNFTSLSEQIGINFDDGTVIGSQEQEENDDEEEGVALHRPLSRVKEEDDKDMAEAEHVESTQSTLLTSQGSNLTAPEVMITPETPAPDEDGHHESKQLGHSSITEKSTSVGL